MSAGPVSVLSYHQTSTEALQGPVPEAGASHSGIDWPLILRSLEQWT
jgi:hypothetical protein